MDIDFGVEAEGVIFCSSGVWGFAGMGRDFDVGARHLLCLYESVAGLLLGWILGLG